MVSTITNLLSFYPSAPYSSCIVLIFLDADGWPTKSVNSISCKQNLGMHAFLVLELVIWFRTENRWSYFIAWRTHPTKLLREGVMKWWLLTPTDHKAVVAAASASKQLKLKQIHLDIIAIYLQLKWPWLARITVDRPLVVSTVTTTT